MIVKAAKPWDVSRRTGNLSRRPGDSDDDEEEEEAIANSRKRKAAPAKGKAARGRPPKKAKTSGKPTNFFIRLRCKENGEGQIYSDAEKGTIKFNKADFSTLTGEVGMPCVGSAVAFTGRKVSFRPPVLLDSWDSYSEAASERARVGRWR